MKIKIRDLLGIGKKANAMDLEQLAASFLGVSSFKELKGSPAEGLMKIFGTVLNGFTLGKKIVDKVAKIKPVINLISDFIAVWAIPTKAAEASQQIILMLYKILQNIVIGGINTTKNLILDLTIDLSNLSLEQLTSLADSITAAALVGFKAIEKGIYDYAKKTYLEGEAFFKKMKSLYEEIEEVIVEIKTVGLKGLLEMAAGSIMDRFTKMIEDVLSSFGIEGGLDGFYDKDIHPIPFELWGDLVVRTFKDDVLQQEDTETIREVPDRLFSIIPTGATGEKKAKETFFPKSTSALDDIADFFEKEVGIKSEKIDLPRTIKDALDGIELAINECKSNFLNDIYKKLLAIDADVVGIEKNIALLNPEPYDKDLEVLHSLKSTFLEASRDNQMKFVKDALDGMFKTDEASLITLYNLAMSAVKEYIRLQLREIKNALLDKLAKIGYDPNNTDPEYIQAVRDILAQLFSDMMDVCFPDGFLNKIFSDILNNYFLTMLKKINLRQPEKILELLEASMETFYSIRAKFLLDVQEQIKKIRLQNITLKDDYYTYSYEDLKTNMIGYLNPVVDDKEILNYDDLLELKDTLKTYLFNMIDIFDENIDSEDLTNIEESILLFRNKLYLEMKDIITKAIMPTPDMTGLDYDVLDLEVITETVKAIFVEYRGKLIEVCYETIYNKEIIPTNIKEAINTKNLSNIETNKIFIKNEVEKNIDSIGITLSDIEGSKEYIKSSFASTVNGLDIKIDFQYFFATEIKMNEIKLINEVISVLYV